MTSSIATDRKIASDAGTGINDSGIDAMSPNAVPLECASLVEVTL